MSLHRNDPLASTVDWLPWVEESALSAWGLAARATPLAGYEGRNFLLDTERGERFVLKVAGESESGDVLDLQNQILRHLAERDLPFATPELMPASSGEEVVHLHDPAGRPRILRLLRHITGRPWSELAEHPGSLLADLGTRLGELTEALRGFTHPAAERTHAWDLARAGRNRPGIAHIPDPHRQALAEAALHGFAALAEPGLEALPRSVLHGDINDANILVREGAGGPHIAAFLDFGDSLEGPTVCELAIALAYALIGQADPLSAASEIVAACAAVHPWSEGEIDLLFPLLRARLAVSVVRAAGHRHEGADDPYLFVSEEPAWDLLEALAPIDPEPARQALRAAAGLPVPGEEGAPPEDLLARRRKSIGPSLSVSYQRPLKIVRGRGQYLYDHRGRPYLDLVNNVNHVGHCHPRVVAAGARQMALLNTNTRYLYDGLTAYAERLTATLPPPLSVCYFVCSGSEANELALRLARTHTGRSDVVILEGAYHGHTGTLIDISPYKFLGPGGRGEAAPHVHMVPVPDIYRGRHRGEGPDLGERYGEEVARAIAAAKRPPAAFLSETLLGCGGQIVPPPGFLTAACRHIRAAGGVAIADEVQVGFGRVGTHFWGFELDGVVPDIVVLGKPIGNGHPMGAVITTPEIAASFDNGMEFFSTFGGNPVSCAIGLAVLDVIAEEGLQERARVLGEAMLTGFRELQKRHPLIGDVRGRGLFVGVELVRDRQTLEPAASETARVVEAMKEEGILLSIDGPLHNVIKIKPPMVLTEEDVAMTVRGLDRVLGG